MTFDETGTDGTLSLPHTHRQPFRPGSLPPGTRILCLAEDPAYANRDILPVLLGAGVAAETMRVGSGDVLDSLILPYQAILFDISSQTSVSFQLCSQIRAVSGMPVMLVLHGAAREDVLRAYHAGADACILAPFDPRELLARLRGLLRRKNMA